MCLLDCEQSLFSLKICKREYLSSKVVWVARAQIQIRYSNTLAYTFSSKRETACNLYVFQCLPTFLLFSDRLNWRNKNTSNHEFSFKISAWPCHGIDTGENNVQVWQTVQVLYFGAREHLFIYLFIYLLFFILLLNCVAANTFGIWNLRNTGKSVTNWVTHTLLWKVWTQESFQKYVEFDRPRERSHCQQQQSYSGLRSPGWSNATYTCYCTHYLILICVLLDAFPYIASFKPWHE